MDLDLERAAVGAGAQLLADDLPVLLSPISDPPASEGAAAAFTAFQFSNRTYMAELNIAGTAS